MMTTPAWKPGDPLTTREEDALLAFADFVDTKRHAPTMQELADAMGIERETATQHFNALVLKGFAARTQPRRYWRGRWLNDAGAARAAAIRAARCSTRNVGKT